MDDESDKKHRHHKKHKHKRHKKHKRVKETNETVETDDTEQEVKLEQIECDLDLVGDEITLTTDGDITLAADDQPFLIDSEHCDVSQIEMLEVIEEQFVEIDDGIGTIDIEEMVLENYGQDYEELEVDVGGVDDENGDEVLGDLDDELADEVEDSDEFDQEDNSQKSKSAKESVKIKSRARDKDKKTKDDGDISSAEEAWLEALESGKLEQVDEELKKIHNPELMTVRQRALLERKGELATEENIKEELVALPTGYKETVMTEELLQKKALKSQRRREVAAQKREKEKKRTIDRLLHKRESRTKGSQNQKSSTANQNSSSSTTSQPSSSQVASYSWKQTSDGNCYLSVPVGNDFPLIQQYPRVPPPAARCTVSGCDKPKRYSCSKTQLPICSLECYRLNLKAH